MSNIRFDSVFKGVILTIIAAAAMLCPVVLSAQVDAVTITGVTPPAPNAGDLVTVNFSYNNASAPWNQSFFCAAVSTYSTLQTGGTIGQTFKVVEPGNGGINTGGTGDGRPVVNGGYGMGDGNGVTSTKTGSFTFNIPTTTEGGTFYIIIGGRADWLDTGSAPAASQASYMFTVPYPPAACSITKTAESSVVRPGDLVLYTVDYNFVNANNLVITDVVPANCTLISQSTGGTNGGTTAGSGLTWVIGNTLARKTAKIFFVAQVNSSTPASTVIHNTAHWSMTENTTGADSNDATVTVGSPVTVTKSQNVSTAAIGDTVTYTLTLNTGGLAFNSYDPFDADISGFHSVGGGTWTWNSDSSGGGYIYSARQGSYPQYLRDTPTDFCFGEISGDILIEGNSNQDGLIAFRNSNIVGGTSYGMGISGDGIPASMYLQEVNPTYAVRSTGGGLISPGTWYTVKILVSDAGGGQINIKGRVWKKGDPDTGIWNIDWTDADGSVPPCGYIGFQGHPNNFNYYDNLKAFKSSAANARVYDTIPAGLSFIGGTAADTTHDAPVSSGGMVSFHLNSPLADTAYSLQWWASVTSCGMLNNTAAYDADGPEPPVLSNSVSLDASCPGSPTETFTPSMTFTATYTFTATPTFTRTNTATFTSTNTATSTPTATNTPLPNPVHTLAKSVSKNPIKPGDVIRYSLSYRNSGTDNATNAVIWDTVPSKLSFTTCSGGLGCTVTAGLVTFNIGTIAPGASGSVYFEALVNETVDDEETISNTGKLGSSESVPFGTASVDTKVDLPELNLDIVTNYPNPFADKTTVVYALSVKAIVTVKFFTIAGELIRKETGINGKAGNNDFIWDGKNDYSQSVSSGVYIVKIEADTGKERAFKFSKLAVMR